MLGIMPFKVSASTSCTWKSKEENDLNVDTLQLTSDFTSTALIVGSLEISRNYGYM